MRNATLWLRASAHRPTLRAHLEAIRGEFYADGWSIAEGPKPPAAVRGPLAVIDDPWIQPFPALARALSEAPAASLRWRVPRVSGLSGPQAWQPRFAPQTVLDYERAALGAQRSPAAAEAAPLWSGFAVASAEDGGALLAEGWPPAGDRIALVPELGLYRYEDPASHERRELDVHVPARVATLVDVGCGAGRFGARWRGPGRTVIGIEPEPDLALAARDRLDLVLLSTAEQGLPSLAAEADCIVFADVLEHTSDPGLVLALARERLAKDGRVLAALPNTAFAPVLRALAAGRWDTTLAGVQARDHRHPLTPASFSRLAARAGLRVERTELLRAELPRSLRWWAWLSARLAGGDPAVLAAPQWICVLRRREDP